MSVQTQLLKLHLQISESTAKGQIFQDSSSAVVISTATAVNPSVITTATAHGRKTGDQVYITGVTTNTAVNNTLSNPNWTITVTSPTTFTVPVLGNGSGTGGTATGALVGSVDSAIFTKQQILDFYNLGRRALMQGLGAVLSPEEYAKKMQSNLIAKTDLQFASGVASKPSGYIKLEKLYDVNLSKIGVTELQYLDTIIGNLSTTNRFVFELGTTFKCYNWTSSIIPDASTYILHYYGLSDFTLSDVLGGATVETFNDEYLPIIVELAVAASLGQSLEQIGSLAAKLLGGQ